MRRFMLSIYKILHRYYEKRWTEASNNMKKHRRDSDKTEFQKYAKLNYKYRIKCLNIIEKHSRLIEGLV